MATKATAKPEAFLAKPRNASEVELEVAKAFSEIAESSTSNDARAAISKLKVLNAKEVEVPETGKKALVVVVPYVAFNTYVKPNQQRCITELEKKTKRHVVFVAHRQVIPKGARSTSMPIRPHSRTITCVHNQLMADLVGPTEIVGKRLHISQDGKRTYKIYLDPRDRTKENVEEKLSTYGAIYKNLTCKTAVFDFGDNVLTR
jgi:small subunit ribosomal protein S7e